MQRIILVHSKALGVFATTEKCLGFIETRKHSYDALQAAPFSQIEISIT